MNLSKTGLAAAVGALSVVLVGACSATTPLAPTQSAAPPASSAVVSSAPVSLPPAPSAAGPTTAAPSAGFDFGSLAGLGTGQPVTSTSTSANVSQPLVSPAPAAADGSSTTMTYSGGTFTISPRIATKVQNKQPLNFVMSYPYITIAGASAQLGAGAKQAADLIEQTYGIKVNTSVIGTANPDPTTQISQIQAGFSADQYDCAAIDPNPPGAFNNLIGTMMGAGVPVYTLNADSPDSVRIATSMTNDNPDDVSMASPIQMGKINAQYAIQWAQQNGQTFDGKQVGLITGDATSPWAQGRLLGFVNGLKEAYPNVEIVGDPMDAYMVGFDTATVLSKLQSFMTSHPDVFFYYSSDWGGVQIGQLIQRNNLQGKVFGMGFNLNAVYVDLIKQNLLIGTNDQRYDLQGYNAMIMCANTLVAHVMPSSPYQWVTPDIWNATNIDTALELYSKMPNSGVTQ